MPIKYGDIACLTRGEDDIYGIGLCLRTQQRLRAFGRGSSTVDGGFVREAAADAVALSPVEYFRRARPCGSLFSDRLEERWGKGEGRHCVSQTLLWVDLTESVSVLATRS